MTATVNIRVNGVSQYSFVSPGETRVLTLDYDHDANRFNYKPTGGYTCYTTYNGRCYDLKRARNHTYFERNLRHFLKAIMSAEICIQCGTAVPKQMTIEV